MFSDSLTADTKKDNQNSKTLKEDANKPLVAEKTQQKAVVDPKDKSAKQNEEPKKGSIDWFLRKVAESSYKVGTSFNFQNKKYLKLSLLGNKTIDLGYFQLEKCVENGISLDKIGQVAE